MKSLRTAKLLITLAIIVLVASAFVLSGQAQAADDENRLERSGLVDDEVPRRNVIDTKFLDNEDERPAMRDKKIREALKRHWSDIENQDVVHEIYHEDVVVEFPQSGERFLGRANLRAMREAYPAKVSATVRQSRGAGDFWVTELVITYDGKKQVNAVSIMEFRGDHVARETLYFGDPWEPPAWRAQWVDQKK